MGGILAFVIGYVSAAALYAYLHMRLTADSDPFIGTLFSVFWPLCLPFLLVFAAAALGKRHR